MSNFNENRGSVTRKSWQEVAKGGGRSFDIENIAKLLERETEEMLTRTEVMQRTLDYFNTCIEQVEDEQTGEIISTWVKNPTKSGYALALGVDKVTLHAYINNKISDTRPFNATSPHPSRIISSEDFDILRRAYTLIEEFYESKLGDNRNNAGVIFWLNNSNNRKWSNEQEFKFVNEEKEVKELTYDDLPILSVDNDRLLDIPEDLD